MLAQFGCLLFLLTERFPGVEGENTRAALPRELVPACLLEGLDMQFLETGFSEALYPFLPPSI